MDWDTVRDLGDGLTFRARTIMARLGEVHVSQTIDEHEHETITHMHTPPQGIDLSDLSALLGELSTLEVTA